ncbi:hypothetical protein [Nocardia vaccinii]|uniref:hypothetical protein n=1 Tax=Nocardia vaccinii TaxID=1822 RepID=UPI000A91DD88|nr:hypothetical protein [Nocardia vaccinii]
MANPYQPGPAPMPSPPSQGYGWPAQPGMPVGQPNSPFPAQRPAGSRNVLTLVAAGLVMLTLVVGIISMSLGESADWLTDWYVLTWVVLVATAVCGAVLALINRNPAAANLTVALSAGMAFIGPFSTLTVGPSGYRGDAYHFWLAIPATLFALTAIVLLYLASRSTAAQSPSRPAVPAQPGWPPQQQHAPGQVPQWPHPPAQNPQPPIGFPAPQPPAGYAPPPVYHQPAGYSQPGFAPQPKQQPSVPQQPLYSSPPAPQPAFGAPQISGADPTVLRPPSGPAENQSPIPQPPNPFGQLQDSGGHATVLQRPGGFGTPPSSETPPTVSPQPDSAAQSPAAPQPGSAPDAPSTNQQPTQAGPGQSGTSTPTPPPASGFQQQPPAQ